MCLMFVCSMSLYVNMLFCKSESGEQQSKAVFAKCILTKRSLKVMGCAVHHNDFPQPVYLYMWKKCHAIIIPASCSAN